MSWRDGDYNRGGYGGGFSGFWAVLNGSVPLGTWFGIRVRVHASLLIFVALVLLFDYSRDYPLKVRLVSMGFLFVTVLLHEFGHCFAARAVGGFADDILMWPLGGLASATPPERPWPTFVTVAGGPMVDVILCILCGVVLWFTTGRMVSLNPMQGPRFEFLINSWGSLYAYNFPYYVWLLFYVNYLLLLFNLLPIYPLDGGRILQTILWPHIGHFRSLYISCITGMIGAVCVGIYALVTSGWMLAAIAISGFLVCYQKRMMLREMGPEGLEEVPDYSASLRDHERSARRRRLSRRMMRRAQRRAAQEQAEQARIDAILEKVSAHGMHSLTWWERRALHKATERQRQRDLELTRAHRED